MPEGKEVGGEQRARRGVVYGGSISIIMIMISSEGGRRASHSQGERPASKPGTDGPSRARPGKMELGAVGGARERVVSRWAGPRRRPGAEAGARRAGALGPARPLPEAAGPVPALGRAGALLPAEAAAAAASSPAAPRRRLGDGRDFRFRRAAGGRAGAGLRGGAAGGGGTSGRALGSAPDRGASSASSASSRRRARRR